jgi:hypothetical protein
VRPRSGLYWMSMCFRSERRSWIRQKPHSIAGFIQRGISFPGQLDSRLILRGSRTAFHDTRSKQCIPRPGPRTLQHPFRRRTNKLSTFSTMNEHRSCNTEQGSKIDEHSCHVNLSGSLSSAREGGLSLRRPRPVSALAEDKPGIRL